MRNSTSCSASKTNTVQDESISTNVEKNSAKKLKQARLPFKVIAPGTPPVDSKPSAATVELHSDKDVTKAVHNIDGRKRKLSYDTDDDCVCVNAGIKDDDNVSKENVEILAATKKMKVSPVSTNDTITEVVSLLEDDENDLESNKDTANSSVSATSKKDLLIKTPKSNGKDKKKGAGTPKTASAQKDKNGSATKLRIKLPISTGKTKRRKSGLKNAATENINNLTRELSSDDIEEVAVELNPQKRKKLNSETRRSETCDECPNKEIETLVVESDTEVVERNISKETEPPTKALKSKEEDENLGIKNNLELCSESGAVAKTVSKVKQPEPGHKSKSVQKHLSNSKAQTAQEGSSNHDNYKKIEICDTSDDNAKDGDDKEYLEQSFLSDNDNEADDETDNLAGRSVSISSDVSVNTKSKPQITIQSQKDGKSTEIASKSLTPKQIKLMEQRRKAREEKERKLQEEKIKKQQEKEEKEVAKKRDREEKEEQRRKDREEKEEQKRKEREEKERKRLAEIEAKNEEKRKKNEAKEEELRKKEEERKRKEQEKEEAELKKKKAAQAFTKFFVAKTPSNSQLKNEEDSNTGDGTKLLAFRPFQIKGDMKLAPITRKIFTAEEKNRLDDLLGCNDRNGVEQNNDEEVLRPKTLPKSQLYLSELRSGKILPGRWRRPSTESKDDVILVEDDLERVGQEIVEELPAYKREEMRVKFYKFHDNRRPPYYGTWRKKSAVVKPRNPFAQDKKFFDYEVDSDDEWEEEEPGESLEDGSDEDKEKESEDDDYEVDNEWFVPHGHLSDEELQNEDEVGMGDDNTREAQKVKLQLLQQEFAQEMKKKTEKIKPRLIGCIWADINGNQPPQCAKILWDTLEKKAMLFTDPPVLVEPEVDRCSEANSPSASNGNTEKASDKLKPISLSDNMVKDLTRLVHGNNHAKNFLINEYIAYVEKTEESVKNGGLRKPLKSVVRDKIDEIAEWQVVDANASSIQEMEQACDKTNDKKKKKVKRRLCWVVKQEMLDKMDLSLLKLRNSWNYTLPPKFVNDDKGDKVDEVVATLTGESISSSTDNIAKGKNSTTPQRKKNTKGKTTKSQNTSSFAKTSSNTIVSSEKKSSSPAPKEKKRVPLLMSVARGQQISTPAKNKLISQFLQQKNNDSVKLSSSISPKTRSNAVTSPNVEDDAVVILD